MLRSFSSAALPGNDAATTTAKIAALRKLLIRFPAPPDRPAIRAAPGTTANSAGRGRKSQSRPDAAIWRRRSIAGTMPLLLFRRPRVVRLAGAVGVELRVAGPDAGFRRIDARRSPVPLVVGPLADSIAHCLLPFPSSSGKRQGNAAGSWAGCPTVTQSSLSSHTSATCHPQSARHSLAGGKTPCI